MAQLSKVTLCLPSYNVKHVIEATLDSIAAQTYTNVKIKVFDNCSTDGTYEVLSERARRNSRIQVRRNKENVGAEGNFTLCIQGAEGDYTGVFHCDDLYRPRMIEEQVQVLDRHPDVVAVFTHADKVDINGKVIGKRFIPPELRKSEVSFLDYDSLLKLTLKYANFLTCPSALMRSHTLLNKIQKWRGKEFKTSADLDVWLRLSQHGKIAFLNKPLLGYRVAEPSFSYRLAKNRTERHDFFLVADAYVHWSRKSLSRRDLANFKFLEFKDSAFRSFNILRNKSDRKFPASQLNFPETLVCGFQTRWHFKVLIFGLAVELAKLVMFWRGREKKDSGASSAISSGRYTKTCASDYPRSR